MAGGSLRGKRASTIEMHPSDSPLLQTFSVSFSPGEGQLLLDALDAYQESVLSDAEASCLTVLLHRISQVLNSSPDQVSNSAPPLRQPPCSWNSVAIQCRWSLSSQLSGARNRSAASLLSDLAATQVDSPSYNATAWAEGLHAMLKKSKGLLDGSNTLEGVVGRCRELIHSEVAGAFLGMVSLIQLAFKCQR